QLEINRALYMDERRYQRSSTFDRLAADLETLARRLGEIPLEQLRPYRAAPEKPPLHKKRAASGCERPKSREETPKEGSGSSRYRTAISYIATHKNQGLRPCFPCYFRMAAARDTSSSIGPCENNRRGTPHRSRNSWGLAIPPDHAVAEGRTVR